MHNNILQGDAINVLKNLPDESVNCCITSPPYYGLRDYGHDSQIGLENTPEEYISKLVDVFRAVRRVLTDDGTLWIVIGDSYAGSGKGASQYPENAKKYCVPMAGICGKILFGANPIPCRKA
jgi:DNA modification methylase